MRPHAKLGHILNQSVTTKPANSLIASDLKRSTNKIEKVVLMSAMVAKLKTKLVAVPLSDFSLKWIKAHWTLPKGIGMELLQ